MKKYTPKRVVHGTNPTAVRRVVDLDDVHRSGGRGDGDAEAEKETTSHELADTMRRPLNNRTDDNEEGTDEHADSASPGVERWADERERYHTTDLVDGPILTAEVRIWGNQEVRRLQGLQSSG